jgi:uncharacterized protein (DUF58 family)
MSDFENAEALLRRLEWTVIRRLDGLLHGDYRCLFRGAGIDLADLREYQMHDDVRHIDWNVTARQDTPFVRVFNEERDITAWFLLDLSPSLDFGSAHTKKCQVALELVAVLARVLTQHGNRVGALFYGSDIDTVIPARSGRRQVLHLLHRIMERPEQKSSQATDLRHFLNRAQPLMARRSMVFVVSDFISTPGWDKALLQLSQRHEVVAVRLFDRMEMEMPDLGLVVVQDAETGEQMLVDTHDARFRQRFIAAARYRETALRLALSEAGVDALELATDDDLMDALQAFIDLRRARSNLSGGSAKPMQRGALT